CMKSTLKAWDRPGMTSEGEHPTGRCVCTFPGGVTLHQGEEIEIERVLSGNGYSVTRSRCPVLGESVRPIEPSMHLRREGMQRGTKEGIADPGAHRITGYSPPCPGSERCGTVSEGVNRGPPLWGKLFEGRSSRRRGTGRLWELLADTLPRQSIGS
ncbi:MAG: hypothetical protein ACTSSA_16000, partial [Candidatus Freyarchaeota archaeon]